MFEKNRIIKLQSRILALEKPYIYNIGDKVKSRPYQGIPVLEGIVVAQSFRETIIEDSCSRLNLYSVYFEYLGVSWNKRDKKWRASINCKEITKNIGSFECEDDAAKAYDAYASKYHGEFANLNFK